MIPSLMKKIIKNSWAEYLKHFILKIIYNTFPKIDF